MFITLPILLIVGFIIGLKMLLWAQLAVVFAVCYFLLKDKDGLEHVFIFSVIAVWIIGILIGDLRYYFCFYHGTHSSVGDLFNWMTKP